MNAPTVTRFRYDSIYARGIAVLALAYMLNAVVQSTDWLVVPELVVGAIWVCGCVVLCRWLNVWGILGLSFAASVIWGLIVAGQPISDFLTFHGTAANAASGGDLASLLGSKSPTTVAYYAAFHAIFGSSFATNYVAGAFAWAVGSFGIYKAVLTWMAEERHARLVCAGVALYPSFVVFAIVPSSEALVFMLTGLSAWLLAGAVRSAGWRRTRLAALIGLAVGLMYLARMNSLLLLAPCIVLLGLVDTSDAGRGIARSLGSRTPPLIALVAGFVLVVVIFGSLCAWKDGGFRARSSPWGEVLLLMGTNTTTHGGYNRADVELAGYASDDPDVRARAPTVARQMAWERVTSDIPRFVSFALTTKIERLWDRERSLSHWSIGDPERRETVSYLMRGAAIFAGDSAYRVVFLVFLVFLVLQVRRPTLGVVLGGIVFLYAMPHIFIEVQPRYHVPMIPFMVAGAAVALHHVANAWATRRRT